MIEKEETILRKFLSNDQVIVLMQNDILHLLAMAMRAYKNEATLVKKLTLTDVSQRYDANKYTPPFRVGRKQGKAVLDGKGIEVVFFMHSEDQAKMYCDYLNNVC